MYLDKFQKMDPIMLMSIINMKLRNEFNGNLDELVKTYSIDLHALEKKLIDSGFTFNKALGKFLPVSN